MIGHWPTDGYQHAESKVSPRNATYAYNAYWTSPSISCTPCSWGKLASFATYAGPADIKLLFTTSTSSKGAPIDSSIYSPLACAPPKSSLPI